MQYNHQPQDLAEEGLKTKVDFRVLLFLFRARLLWFLLAFVIITLLSWGTVKLITRNSMNNWSGISKLFHQTRSDKVPSFYKQLDTKSIAELVGTQSTMRRAVTKFSGTDKASGDVLGPVTVEVMKDKNNIIQITANYNSPKKAAAIANAIAEAGVEEYVEFQNATLKTMLTERRRRRSQLLNELESMEQEISKYVSRKTSMTPDEELNHARKQLADELLILDNMKMKCSELTIKRDELKKNLGVVDREIRYMHKIHGGNTAELERMKKDLVRLEEKYTDKNPRVKFAREELAQRESMMKDKEQSPDEIIYSANQVYLSLQETLLRTEIDLKATTKNLQDYESKIAERQKTTMNLVESLSAYNALSRKIASTKITIQQLEVSINDLDFLLNSSVPDLAVLELASPPKKPNMSKVLILAFFLAFLLSGGIVAVYLGYDIFFGRIKSEKDFAFVTGWENLGEIPLSCAKVKPEEVQAEIMSSFNKLRTILNGKKKIFICELENAGSSNNTLAEWIEYFGVNGYRVFRLKVLPQAMKEEFHVPNEKKTAEGSIDNDLICIEKFANKGFFYHTDRLFLAPAECDLLNVDLELLGSHYDLILLEFPPLQSPQQIFVQLLDLSDYSIVFAEFNKISKPLLRHLNLKIGPDRIKKIASVLVNVIPPYWRTRV